MGNCERDQEGKQPQVHRDPSWGQVALKGVAWWYVEGLIGGNSYESLLAASGGRHILLALLLVPGLAQSL